MKKGFILGFTVAAILFTAIGAGAYTLVPSTVKLVVDGVEVKDDKLPILYMEPGYNYVPAATFRSICDKIGVGFEYVGETDTIEINTKVKETATVEPIVQEVKSTSETIEKITQTSDGLNVYCVDNINYICVIDFNKKYESETGKNYDIGEKWSPDGNSDNYILYSRENGNRPDSTNRATILLENIPHIGYGYPNHAIYIPQNYYIATISPLMQ